MYTSDPLKHLSAEAKQLLDQLAHETNAVNTLFSPTGPVQAIKQFELLIEFLTLKDSSRICRAFDLNTEPGQAAFKLFVYYLIASPHLNKLKLLKQSDAGFSDQEHPLNINNCYQGMQAVFCAQDVAVASKVLVSLLEIYEHQLTAEDVYIGMANHFTTLLARVDMVKGIAVQCAERAASLEPKEQQHIHAQVAQLKAKLVPLKQQLGQLTTDSAQQYVDASLASLHRYQFGWSSTLADVKAGVNVLENVQAIAEGDPHIVIDLKPHSGLFTALDVASVRVEVKVKKRQFKFSSPKQNDSTSSSSEGNLPDYKRMALVFDESQRAWYLEGIDWRDGACYRALATIPELHDWSVLLKKTKPTECQSLLENADTENELKVSLSKALHHVTLYDLNLARANYYLTRRQHDMLSHLQLQQLYANLHAAIMTDDATVVSRALGGRARQPLAHHVDMSIETDNGYTALTVAALAGKQHALVSLLQYGYPVNHVNSNNKTTLEIVCGDLLSRLSEKLISLNILLLFGAKVSDSTRPLLLELSALRLVNSPLRSEQGALVSDYQHHLLWTAPPKPVTVEKAPVKGLQHSWS